MLVCRRVRPAVVLLFCVLTGCLRTGDSYGPFDDESLRFLCATEKHWPELGKPDEHRVFEITEHQTNSLVEALRPIKSVEVGELPLNAVDYTLYFQPSRDPVIFNVHVSDGHLVYAERRYLYKGGDAQAFKRIADEIMAGNPGKRGIIVQSSRLSAGTEDGGREPKRGDR